MHSKFLFFFLFALFLSFQSTAQSIMHSIGGTPTLLVSKDNPETGSEKFTLFQTLITYFLRFNFISNENSSVSFGLPLGGGIGIVQDLGGYSGGVAFAYDLPAVIDYNFGFKSTPEAEGKFGGYFGIGYGYHKVNISEGGFGNFTGATHGPIFRGGLRFGSSNESWGNHGVTIGLFYKKGLETSKLSTYGVNVLYDL